MIKVSIILFICSIQTLAIFFPIISFSKETGNMVGAFIQRPLSNTSDVQLFLLTQSKGHSGFLNTTNIPIGSERLNIKVYGSNTGKSFYGIGNLEEKTTEKNLYFNEFNTTINIEKPINKRWDALLGVKFTHYKENTEKNNHAKIFNDLNDVGVIIGAQIDTRNKEFNTTNGYFNEIKALIYNHHQIVSNDVRYFKPYKNSVLASKFYSIQTFTNNNHIQYLTGVGNYYYLRGYKTNDIMDQHLTYAQFEWRTSLTTWFTLSPFIEAGVIGKNISYLKKTLFSYGLGGYFAIGSGAFRLESAYAENNSEFYFGFNHVF